MNSIILILEINRCRGFIKQDNGCVLLYSLIQVTPSFSPAFRLENCKTSLQDLILLNNLEQPNKGMIQCQDFSYQFTKFGPAYALHLFAVPGQAVCNLNLFVSGKDDPEFLYSLTGKIGANVSKNINLRAYAPIGNIPFIG